MVYVKTQYKVESFVSNRKLTRFICFEIEVHLLEKLKLISRFIRMQFQYKDLFFSKVTRVLGVSTFVDLGPTGTNLAGENVFFLAGLNKTKPVIFFISSFINIS